MLKVPAEKTALAEKIRKQTEKFLAAGGEIQHIPFGILTQPAGWKRSKNPKTNGVPMTVSPNKAHHWRNEEHVWPRHRG